MGVEELRKEILEEAERKVNEILSEAKEEANKILKDAEKRVEEIKKAREAEVRKRMEEKLRSEVSLARIEGKKLIVNTKWEIVDEVFNKAWERFIDFGGEEDYFNVFIPKMVAYGASRIGVDEVLLHLNSNDAKRVKGMMGKLARDVSKFAGRKIKLFIAEKPVNIRGGVIVSDVDEKVYFNASFDALFKRAREELASTVFELLFGGGE